MWLQEKCQHCNRLDLIKWSLGFWQEQHVCFADYDLVRLIQSDFTDTFQKISFNDTLSRNSAILWGVPQGSTLAPLLFIIYKQYIYILNSVNLYSVAAYTDEKQMYHHFKISEYIEAENIIISELHKIQHLSEERGHLLNSKTSQAICLGKLKLKI